MKRTLYTLLFALSLALTSCGGDKDSEILFSVETNSNPDNITLEYYSPDPSCVGKIYHLVVGKQSSGDIVLNCTNLTGIYIPEKFTPAEDCAYTVTAKDNTLTLHFNPCKSDMTLEPYDYFFVYALDNGKEVSANFTVYRTTFNN